MVEDRVSLAGQFLLDSKGLYDPYNPKESEWLRKGIVDKIIALRKVNDTGTLVSAWS